jgi:hypothetical protein
MLKVEMALAMAMTMAMAKAVLDLVGAVCHALMVSGRVAPQEPSRRSVLCRRSEALKSEAAGWVESSQSRSTSEGHSPSAEEGAPGPGVI